mmetsp:Transcript_22434/g.29077  ORF Transcript_22434/g.29077 Transcript_22434/m.29077 type:complete len:227 (+) Transcript_22434:65-745(+)
MKITIFFGVYCSALIYGVYGFQTLPRKYSFLNSALKIRSPAQRIVVSASRTEEVVIPQNFRLPVLFLGTGLFFEQLPILKYTLGPLTLALALLFFVQSFRIRFVCDDKAFSLKESKLWTRSDELGDTGQNIVVGGDNSWTYSSFVNYETFPKGWIDLPQGPILIYFKETQTDKTKWSEGPGQSANSPDALAKGAIPGQVHFFPALCDAKALISEWEKRGAKKISST